MYEQILLFFVKKLVSKSRIVVSAFIFINLDYFGILRSIVFVSLIGLKRSKNC